MFYDIVIMVMQVMKLKLNGITYPIIIANNLHLRFTGLMGKKNISYGMLFPKCNAIHTFFMKEAIDVIGINANNEVISIVKNVGKNRIVSVSHAEKKTSILELPTSANLIIEYGDILSFEREDIL